MPLRCRGTGSQLSPNELPADGDWERVDSVVYARRKALKWSIARLAREAGVSETTVRYLHRPEKRNKSTLVAISAALGYRHDYLVRVLNGTDSDDGLASKGLSEEMAREIVSRLAAVFREERGNGCLLNGLVKHR